MKCPDKSKERKARIKNFEISFGMRVGTHWIDKRKIIRIDVANKSAKEIRADLVYAELSFVRDQGIEIEWCENG